MCLSVPFARNVSLKNTFLWLAWHENTKGRILPITCCFFSFGIKKAQASVSPSETPRRSHVAELICFRFIDPTTSVLISMQRCTKIRKKNVLKK